MDRTILVVDEDPIFINLVRYKLQTMGFELVTAKNKTEFWDALCDTRPDAILIDLGLIHCLDFAFAKERMSYEADFDPSTPVFFVSSFVDEETAQALAQQGKFTIYNKYGEFEELSEDMAEFLHQKAGFGHSSF